MKFSDLKIGIASRRSHNSSEISANSAGIVGIILDSEEKELLQSFLDLQEDLNIQKENFHLLICAQEERHSGGQYPVFLRKHLKWNGKLGNERVADFVRRDYDVLISFTDPKNKLSAFLVSVIRAELKVGIGGSRKTEALFDLLIKVAQHEEEIFIQETKKYLTLITRKTA